MNKEKISEILHDEGIELFAFLSMDDCRITKKYLLDRVGIERGSTVIMAVPYVSKDFGKGNISEYAKGRDYHLYWRQLFDRVIPLLSEEFPQHRFCGFADHSPIDERDAAARGGLGIIGRNGLIITEKHSSFVFLGEIITDMVFESEAREPQYCENCSACLRACPFGLDGVCCLSAITQKKGELDSRDTDLIKKHGSAWGCDLCQSVCPHTKKALNEGTIYTSLPFFLENRLPLLTYPTISEMSDEDFSRRAYSWRGRNTILRNLELLEKDG